MKVKAEFKVVEVDKQSVLDPAFEEANQQAVASLQHHPGFVYLLAKLAFERAALKTALEKTRHKSIVDVEFIQSGAFWSNWLQLQLESAIGKINQPKPRAPRSYEADAFEQLRQNVELVGLKRPDNGGAEVGPQVQG